MSDCVSLQMSLISEISITHIALVRPLLWLFGVKTLVFLEETEGHTNLVTLVTLIELSADCEQIDKFTRFMIV